VRTHRIGLLSTVMSAVPAAMAAVLPHRPLERCAAVQA
jgi:hypothetical protein